MEYFGRSLGELEVERLWLGRTFGNFFLPCGGMDCRVWPLRGFRLRKFMGLSIGIFGCEFWTSAERVGDAWHYGFLTLTIAGPWMACGISSYLWILLRVDFIGDWL